MISEKVEERPKIDEVISVLERISQSKEAEQRTMSAEEETKA